MELRRNETDHVLFHFTRREEQRAAVLQHFLKGGGEHICHRLPGGSDRAAVAPVSLLIVYSNNRF